MPIKVLGIHSSPHSGGTADALRYALDRAAETGDVITEMADLRKGGCHPCLHCDRCIRENLYSCPVFSDAITPLYEKIREADVIMLASPVYDMAPTAQMAALIGRLRPLGKCTSAGEWGRKVGCAIAVGGSRNGGEETTLSVLNRYILALGMNLAGPGVYAYSGASVWSRNHHDSRVTEEDEHNRMVLSCTARRAVVLAKLIKAGLEAQPELSGCRTAGFLDEEDRRRFMEAFWRP